MKTIGEKVKTYIEDNGIRQKFIANAAGMSDSAMSQFLNGKRRIDALEYYKLCKALNVPMEYFIEQEG